jgi:AraC family transcriptional regulator of adaptative response/methylated-DNA-[protein]-cysteine methyltransferase
VLARDARFDGIFVYAVRSTGVYCRPSCPSRRPRRDSVEFFNIPQAAESAGYRPCRRCRPNAAQKPSDHLVVRACHYIAEHADNGGVSLHQMAAALGASPFHLQRAFKAKVGVSPREYSAALRERKLERELRQSRSVADAVYAAGYGSSSRVYERASDRLGMTPATYRAGGRGAQIRYSIAPCSLGYLLVAATDRGICRISLDDTPESLATELRSYFPAAEITEDTGSLREWVEPIVRSIESSSSCPTLPLDVRATAFQQRVWNYLREIPLGETRTYSQVARDLGDPNATRAVARACATNPVALIVPCHRVLRRDGNLGGYRWGLERKRKLLAGENKAAQGGGTTGAAPHPMKRR